MILKTFLLTLLTTSSTFCFDRKQINFFITRNGSYEVRFKNKTILQYKPNEFLTFCAVPEIGLDEDTVDVLTRKIDSAIKRMK